MTHGDHCDYMQIMNILIGKNLPIMALLLSGGLLGGAWFFEYVLHYAPCQMCYWQRHAHKTVLAIAAIAIGLALAGKRYPRAFALLLGLAFLVSFGLAFWHVGVEYKWWEGPKTCMAGGTLDIDLIDDPTKFWEQADKAKPPACSDAAWWFLGLSMAGWNAAASFAGAVLSFASLKRVKNV